MMKYIPNLVTLVLLAASTLSHAQSDPTKNLIVITDMEPDDRIALNLLAVRFPKEIAFVGTTVMHSARKYFLARQLLDQVGLFNIPVFQGAGGTSDVYPEIASSRAAREYEQEGRGIIPESDLDRLNNTTPRSSNNLAEAIVSQLRTYPNTEVVLLAPPTDLVAALDAEPELRSRISHIHVMGGWVQGKNSEGVEENRTTYNWNMDPESSSRLMRMSDIPMTLYSSHMIKPSFSGGSINADNFPKIISEIDRLRFLVPSLKTFSEAGGSWDHHLMDKIPPLRNVIGENAGRQFTPADPAVVVGMIRPDFILEQRAVSVQIDLANVDAGKGFSVKVIADSGSRINLVEAVDPVVFQEEVMKSFKKLEKRAVAIERKGMCRALLGGG